MNNLELNDAQLVELSENELIDNQGGILPLLAFCASVTAGAYFLGKEIGRVW